MTKKTVLDHVAVGARELQDGWDLFSGVLGGSWACGGDSPGFWWGQLTYRSGPKIELLRPTGGSDAAFLERFLATRAAGPHHFNFVVADLTATLSRVRALGIEPVQISLLNPHWKEAFLHPKDAYGIVVQVAEQSAPPPARARPAELPAAGPSSAFSLIEHEVADLEAALALFGGALAGEFVRRSEVAGAPAAELGWDNGARLRLVQGAVTGAAGSRPWAGRLRRLCFTRDGSDFTAADQGQAAGLARRLGVTLGLGPAS